MFIKMPIPTIFYKGWKEIQIENKIKLAELCGLTFTGDFNEEEPEFIGNDKCWSNFKKQLNIC